MLKASAEIIRGIRTFHPAWQVWAVLLVAVNLLCLPFLNHVEALWTLFAVVIALGIGLTLTARMGYTRLLGIMHLPWLALVPWLYSRLESIPPSDPFGYWVQALIVMNSLSLMIDTADVARYFRGESGVIQ